MKACANGAIVLRKELVTLEKSLVSAIELTQMDIDSNHVVNPRLRTPEDRAKEQQLKADKRSFQSMLRTIRRVRA